MLSRDAEDELVAFLHMCFKDDVALGIDVRWKKGVLEECLRMLGGDPYQEALHAEKILRLIAEPYKEHPDYKPEWLL